MSHQPPPVSGAAPASDDPGLVRGVGRWTLVALTLNLIIGSGIFGLPSRIHAMVGPWSLLAYGACAVVVALIALCFAEVSSRYTITGGPYLYAHRAFGPVVAFAIGWLMWLTRVSSIAAVINVMTSYVAFFWPAAGAGAGRATLMSVVLAGLTAINLVGIRQAAGAGALFTIGKLVPLLLFVAVGLFHVDPGAFSGIPAPSPGQFSETVLILIFAFVGFEVVTISAGETHEPRRDIPFALFTAIGASTVLYVLIQTVAIGTLPSLAASERPLADAAVRFAGTWGGALISLGAIISIVGGTLGSILAGPRVLYAMAARGQIPSVLARTHPRFHTPHLALLLTAGAGLALAISGTFVYLLTLSVIARLTSYLATALALVVFRGRPDEPPARIRLPGGPWIVALTCAACVWLLTTSGLRELRDVAIATAAGLALYAWTAAGRARRRS